MYVYVYTYIYIYIYVYIYIYIERERERERGTPCLPDRSIERDLEYGTCLLKPRSNTQCFYLLYYIYIYMYTYIYIYIYISEAALFVKPR